MDLAKIDDEDDEDGADKEDESDTPDDQNEISFKETGNITMAFQERSLREYFQAVDVDSNGLRTPPRTGHLTIFEMTASRLLEGCARPNYAMEKNLLDYAASFWIRHFVELDPSSATDQEIGSVVDKLYRFFQNTNNIARTLEYYSARTYSEMLPGNDLSWLKNVESWIQRGKQVGADNLGPEVVTWMNNFVIETAFLTLARGHVENWFKEYFGKANIECIRFARDALSLVSLVGSQDL